MFGRVDRAEPLSDLAPFIDDAEIAWDANGARDRVTRPLSEAVLAELHQKRAQLAGPVTEAGVEVDPEGFPVLRDEAQRVLGDRLDQGLGFVILRGLATIDLTQDEMQAAFWLFCRALGEPMVQKGGDIRLGRVANLGKPAASRPRYHETGVGGSVHTDSPIMPRVADIVGLLCLQTAQDGGLSKFVSVARVHNILLRHAPDLLRELYLPFDFDRRIDAREVSATNPALLRAPIFSYLPDKGLRGVRLRWQPEYVWEAPELPGVRPLTERQRMALHLLEGVLEDRSKAITVEVAMIPGDMQFLNNHLVAHGRTAFVDPPATADGAPPARREMRRVWLRRTPH